MNTLFMFPMFVQIFADMKTNTTTQTGSGKDLSAEMKTYYSDYLIDLAEPELVHDQFGQKHPIPKNGGKTIEFRQYDPLPEMTTALTEGVTPDGQSLNVKKLEATVKQYGGYVTLSDLLMLTAIDNNLVQATKLIASQAGRTLDTITRDILNAGTVVQYADGSVSARADLVGGSTTDSENNYLTVDAIKKAVRTLEAQDAPKINGYYVGIIHPNAKYDLMKDPDWKTPHEYVDTANVYKNEIGELYGVRFVQSSRAKVWANAAKNKSTGTAVASSRDVYSTLILADDAYGITDISGGGLQHIVKQLGSAGSGDPLDQRATVGWKATKTAEILVQQYMVRIETTVSA
jgi:N4-gp56 family major capsid protein